MQTILSDEEKQELFFLRQKVKELEEENKILKANIIDEKSSVPVVFKGNTHNKN